MGELQFLKQGEKTAFFIDGANLYKSARSLGFDIDYKVLLKKSRNECALVRASYYTVIQEDRDQEYSPLRPLVDWLDYNGFRMVTKPAREFCDANGRRHFRGSTDVELSVDMLTLAPHIDHAIIFSGNGDFRRAIEAVQDLGVRVSVVSTIKTSPPMASDDLRRQADTFIDLAELEEFVGRTVNCDVKKSRLCDDDDDYDYAEECDDDYE